MIPTAPDGRYHYHIAVLLSDTNTYGEMPVSTQEPLLATDGSLAEVRATLAEQVGQHIVITGVSLLAAPA